MYHIVYPILNIYCCSKEPMALQSLQSQGLKMKSFILNTICFITSYPTLQIFPPYSQYSTPAYPSVTGHHTPDVLSPS